jgi:outer membrane protein assembly factor BamB
MKMSRQFLLILSVLIISGCDMFTEEHEIMLPGERISVLLHQRSINADPELAGTQILLPAPAPNENWPQSGGYANHAMHHMQTADALGEQWRADIGESASDENRIVSTPVAAAGMVFALDADSGITAIRADNGKTVWSRNLAPEVEEDDGHISGGLAYYQGRIFVTTGFGDVISLDANSGQEIWREYVRGPMRSAPTVRSGRVFALTIDNRLLALNAETGETLWTHAGIGESANLLGGGSPAVDGNVVIVPYSSGELVALDLESGNMLWSDTLTAIRRTDAVSTLSHIRGNPVIDRGRVIAVSHGGVMASIDMASGQRVWDRELGGMGTPWVAGEYIYVLTNEAEIACLSRQDGRIFWVRGLPRFEDMDDRTDPIVWSGPILASDRLIVTGSHGEAWAVSPYTGSLLGRIELPDNISVPPILAGGTVYFLADNASIVAYH